MIHSSDAGHFVLLKDKGQLLQYTPQGVAGFPEGFKDKSGFYFGMRATLSVIAHNPKIVSDKDAPKTWKELLNPKWKGKMVSAHPGYSGIIATHVLALVNLYGWDYVRDLGKNGLHLVQSANDLIGTNGITAADCLQVSNALAAVQMTNRWPCTPLHPLVPDLSPPDLTVSNLFFDDLENITSGNWETSLSSSVMGQV